MANAGARLALCFGGAGLVAALVLLLTLGLERTVWLFPVGVGVGSATTLFVSWWLGARVERSMATGSFVRAAMLGSFVAVASLELGVLVGSLPQLFASGGIQRLGLRSALFDYVVKPVYWVSLFGLAPAAGLGVCFGLTLRRHLLR